MLDTLSLSRRWCSALPIVALLAACSDTPIPTAPMSASAPVEPLAALAPDIIVTNTDDDGPGSLRQAIRDVPDDGVIHFDPAIAGGVVSLTSGYLLIERSVTIEGPAQGMTISGDLTAPVFQVGAIHTVLRNVSIVNGHSKVGGGVNLFDGELTLDHVLVSGNDALSGGAIEAQVGTILVVLNSTISGNVTAGSGAIFAEGVVTIRNSTIANNTAGGAGGIAVNDGIFTIQNSIVANNFSTDLNGVSNCYVGATATYTPAGANISDDASCGAPFTVGDAKLVPLAQNGGPTRTHALMLGSAAIDAGVSCTESDDQRYVARPQGATCDLGAYEFDAYRAVTLTISPNIAVNTKTGVATVTGTISCPVSAATPLAITLSQTQKVTGRFTTIVQGQANIPATCTPSPTSWSVALAPASGKFSQGSATGSARVISLPGGYVSTPVSGTLKLYQVK